MFTVKTKAKLPICDKLFVSDFTVYALTTSYCALTEVMFSCYFQAECLIFQETYEHVSGNHRFNVVLLCDSSRGKSILQF